MRRGEWKYVHTPDNEEFLFQLLEDPYESKNMAVDEVKLLSDLRVRSEEMRAKFHRNN